jgi:hypothetical protein
MKSISLEQFNDGYRLLVFVKLGGNTVVEDIAQSDELVELAIYLAAEHPDARAVRINGVDDEPDCLTVFEAAEAAMIDLR